MIDIGKDTTCRLVGEFEALQHFATYQGPTQSQKHIKPLHWYAACRLVLEGGFLPEEITPHPPFRSKVRGGTDELAYDADAATKSESTILGGLKTKNVDVVATKAGIGPVLAVSVKGTIGAFRNLTNRMEEAVGDCTNLHITYPAMVMGFLTVLRGNQAEEDALENIAPENASPARKIGGNDVAIAEGGRVVETIIRYHNALRELSGRAGVRDDVSRYEAVGMALVESNRSERPGFVIDEFPTSDSLLRSERFFDALYQRYDERYVYAAPDLHSRTRRREWSQSSPLFSDKQFVERYSNLGYTLRLKEA